MYNTYVIISETGRIYIGHTSDLEARLKRHNQKSPNKKTSFTSKNGKNWELFYKETFNTREDASRREKELKSCQGRKFLKNLRDVSSVGRSASRRTIKLTGSTGEVNAQDADEKNL